MQLTESRQPVTEIIIVFDWSNPYPDSSLADLYDPVTMPSPPRQRHSSYADLWLLGQTQQ